MAIITSLKKDEVNDIAKTIYENYEEKTGNVPEWVKVMAHQPQILKEFTKLFDTIMNHGEVDASMKWKIAYVVSETLKCEFCVSVTIGMLKKLGASNKLLTQINKMNNFPKKERHILSLVKDITLDGRLDKPEILTTLKRELTESEMVEVVSVIGLFNYINRFNNAFIILPV